VTFWQLLVRLALAVVVTAAWLGMSYCASRGMSPSGGF
jgi:hypothetical protein